MSETEEAITRIKNRVKAFIFIGPDGTALRNNLPEAEKVKLTSYVN